MCLNLKLDKRDNLLGVAGLLYIQTNSITWNNIAFPKASGVKRSGSSWSISFLGRI